MVVQGKAAFTLLRPVSNAGLQPVQFDRGGRLLASKQQPGSREQWQAEIDAALSDGSCVLVTPRHLVNPLFGGFDRFDLLIEYSPALDGGSGGDQQQRQLFETIRRHFGGRHFGFTVAPPSCDGAVAAGPQDQQQDHQRQDHHQQEQPPPPPQQQQQQQQQDHHQQPQSPQQQRPPRRELPVVISCCASSVLRRRRDLYDAVLRLEQQLPGAALVERPVELADVVLTPRACACFWTADNLPLAEVGLRFWRVGGN